MGESAPFLAFENMPKFMEFLWREFEIFVAYWPLDRYVTIK